MPDGETELVSKMLTVILAVLLAAQAPAVAPGTEAVVETPKGSFTIRLLPEVAPKHAALFVKTAKAGGYDGTTFHRVIMGGIIQGGDPLTKDPAKASQYGSGGLGLLKAEISDKPFVRGTVAAVRRPSSMDSAGTQFFVCLQPQPSLAGQYTDRLVMLSGGMVVADGPARAVLTEERIMEHYQARVRVMENGDGLTVTPLRRGSGTGSREA